MMLSTKYMQHIVSFNLNFPTVEEYEMRKELFGEIDAFIELHNSTESNFTLGHNMFSTMTEAEKMTNNKEN